uniref:Uncharacterized protein n=1 Tax=Triticum urartu TaxID=4572 RepID=A0A8R7U458_TRIUA
MVSAAGTSTGLKSRNTGVATASPTTVPASASPDSTSSSPPSGNSVATVSACDADGAFSWSMPFICSPIWRPCCCPPWCPPPYCPCCTCT